MEEAIIFIEKTERGKLIATIKFKNGKSMNLPSLYKIDESLNNKACEVERVKGQIVRVLINGKELETIDKTAYTTLRDSADAPYNFIPLNKSVIGAEEIPSRDFDFDKYHSDRYTGYIACELETVTPLYIRGTIEKDKYKQEEKSKDISDFFSPGGKLKIPGSSLRGMLRTLVEIVTFGKFSFFDDRLLHYRGLADKSNLIKEYQKNMSSYNKKTKSSIYKFNAGYLKKDYIIPAKIEGDKQFKQIEKRNKDEEFIIERQNNGKYLVISGKMQNKKHDWLINEPDFNANKIEVLEKDIEAYEKDESRTIKEEIDPLKRADKGKEAPCFYVQWDTNRISFGHTGFFRLAYKKTIEDHIPDELKNQDIVDIPEAIFGKESQFATRVFFEDAELLPGQINVLMEETVPNILASPKPTTFQHYLEQDSDDIRSLKHYNTDANANIRGYKLYWHRDNIKWQQIDKQEINKHKTQYTRIKPVRPNTKFKFRIRFENLSEVELGVLLFVLDLPENSYHKLGMAKPLGLGSIKIRSRCFISNRAQRYKKLFHNRNWNLPEDSGDIAEFKQEFERYILDKISLEEKGNAKNLWETERLKKLKIMLDFENTKKPNWSIKTSYMKLEKFRERLVLPSPDDVIENKT